MITNNSSHTLYRIASRCLSTLVEDSAAEGAPTQRPVGSKE
jgi:hypothetical protein